ncbi:MAG: EamA family transporter, partial [Gammaproteobacteria bacterium]
MSEAPVPGPRHARYADLALVIVGALMISMKGVLTKLLYREGVTVEAVILLRAWISLPLFWGWACYRVGLSGLVAIPPRLMRAAVVAGVVCYYFGTWLDFKALALIDASLERVLLFAYPTIVVLARAAIDRRPPGRRVVAALLLTYVGIVLAVGGFEPGLWRANGVGALLVLVAAGTFAYYLMA